MNLEQLKWEIQDKLNEPLILCNPHVVLRLIAIAEAAKAFNDRRSKSSIAIGILRGDVYPLLSDLGEALDGVD